MRRQRGNFGNRLVKLESTMMDWATTRRLGLGAAIRPNLVIATARRLGARVRDFSERLEKVRVRD